VHIISDMSLLVFITCTGPEVLLSLHPGARAGAGPTVLRGAWEGGRDGRKSKRDLSEKAGREVERIWGELSALILY